MSEEIVATTPPDTVSITETLSAALANRLKIGLPAATARTDELLDFLRSTREGETSVPSRLVDEAWHVFILHTRLYEAWCWREMGRFIHHVPDQETSNDDYVRTLLRMAGAVTSLGGSERADCKDTDAPPPAKPPAPGNDLVRMPRS